MLRKRTSTTKIGSASGWMYPTKPPSIVAPSKLTG